MTNYQDAIRRLFAVTLAAFIVGIALGPHTGGAVEATAVSPDGVAVHERSCGSPQDDPLPSTSTSWIDLSAVERKHHFDLPDGESLPRGFSMHEDALLEEDEAGRSVMVFYLDASKDDEDEGLVTVNFLDESYFADYDPTSDLVAGEEIGWHNSAEGHYVIVATNDSGVGETDLKAIACSMSSYTGMCP